MSRGRALRRSPHRHCPRTSAYATKCVAEGGVVRVVAVRECTVPISRYATNVAARAELDTTAVAVITDVHREGEPVVGFGFSSIGRFGQGGLIRDRFAPRLVAAADGVASASGDNIDPFRAWDHMMRG